MGGTNPYIKPVETKLPTKTYTIEFLPMGTKVEVDPAKLPYSREGQKGSILEIALGHGIEIDHACGGVCACSTCHVYVKQGLGDLAPASDREEDIMDKAFDVKPNSRLGCQSKILRETTVVCEISRESRQAFLDEHPEIRAKLKEAQAAQAQAAQAAAQTSRGSMGR
jgi:2Fe-2S ferredoxin